MVINNNPIADITRLASSIHTTRAILRARFQAIAESLPQIPEPINQTVWLADSPYYGKIELSISSNLGLKIHYTQPQPYYWRPENVPAYLLAPAAAKVEELLTKLQGALVATEKKEVVLAGKL